MKNNSFVRPTQGIKLNTGGYISPNLENIGGRIMVAENYSKHRQKLRTAKPTVDTRPPWGHVPSKRSNSSGPTGHHPGGAIPTSAISLHPAPMFARPPGDYRRDYYGEEEFPRPDLSGYGGISESVDIHDPYSATSEFRETEHDVQESFEEHDSSPPHSTRMSETGSDSGEQRAQPRGTGAPVGEAAKTRPQQPLSRSSSHAAAAASDLHFTEKQLRVYDAFVSLCCEMSAEDEAVVAQILQCAHRDTHQRRMLMAYSGTHLEPN